MVSLQSWNVKKTRRAAYGYVSLIISVWSLSWVYCNLEFMAESILVKDIVPFLQLRRQARLRREYIYRKSIEDRERTILEKKQKLKNALDGRNSWVAMNLGIFFHPKLLCLFAIVYIKFVHCVGKIYRKVK